MRKFYCLLCGTRTPMPHDCPSLKGGAGRAAVDGNATAKVDGLNPRLSSTSGKSETPSCFLCERKLTHPKTRLFWDDQRVCEECLAKKTREVMERMYDGLHRARNQWGGPY